jgi:hypothetical protein
MVPLLFLFLAEFKANCAIIHRELRLQRCPAILHISGKSSKSSGEHTMSHFTRSLSAGILAAVVAGAVAFISAATAAPKLSEADDIAIKEAIGSCKAEAKAKKIRFPASRSFLRDCVTETIRNNPPKR